MQLTLKLSFEAKLSYVNINIRKIEIELTYLQITIKLSIIRPNNSCRTLFISLKYL
jgi:hypothetical protein